LTVGVCRAAHSQNEETIPMSITGFRHIGLTETDLERDAAWTNKSPAVHFKHPDGIALAVPPTASH
jgi:hypothetical protein